MRNGFLKNLKRLVLLLLQASTSHELDGLENAQDEIELDSRRIEYIIDGDRLGDSQITELTLFLEDADPSTDGFQLDQDLSTPEFEIFGDVIDNPADATILKEGDINAALGDTIPSPIEGQRKYPLSRGFEQERVIFASFGVYSGEISVTETE